ncbi:unnamed protein product, partial [Ostreobium quekettii]
MVNFMPVTIWVVLRKARVQQALRRVASGEDGLLTREQLVGVLKEKRIAEDDAELDRIVDTLQSGDPAGIAVSRLADHFLDNAHPLGPPAASVGRDALLAPPWEKRHLSVVVQAAHTGGAVPESAYFRCGSKNGKEKQTAEDVRVLKLIESKFRKNERSMRRVFERMDTAKAGKMSRADFGAAINAVGLAIPDQQMDRLFKAIDPKNSGTVDHREFMKSFGSTMGFVQK